MTINLKSFLTHLLTFHHTTPAIVTAVANSLPTQVVVTVTPQDAMNVLGKVGVQFSAEQSALVNAAFPAVQIPVSLGDVQTHPDTPVPVNPTPAG